MTCAPATCAPVEAKDSDLLPRGLRLGIFALICGAHVGLIVLLSLAVHEVHVLAPLNVDLVPQGDYFVDTVEVAGPAAAEPINEPQPPVPPEPAPTPDAATPPPPSADATPSAAAPPAPDLREAELEAQQKARQLEAKKQAEERARREKRLREQAKRNDETRREERRRAAAAHPAGSQAHRAGVADGQTSRAARLNYAAIIAAALARQKFYPPAARARGETGSVGVTFTVAGSGGIGSYSIYRSSGSSALDGAVRSIMARTHAPPPPGGSFHGNISINFNLGE